MPRPAAAILLAFDGSAPPPAAPSLKFAAVSLEPIVLPVKPVPPPERADASPDASPTAGDTGNDIKSLQDRLAEAFERGREDGSLAARAEEEARQEAAAIWAEAERAELRRLWSETEGDRLAAAIAAAFETLERNVADAAAAALEPFVDSALRDRVAADFAEQLRRASDYGAVAMALSGPADLLDSIRAALGPLADRVACDPCDRIEARAVVGRTTIETRLAEWLRAGPATGVTGQGGATADRAEPVTAASG